MFGFLKRKEKKEESVKPAETIPAAVSSENGEPVETVEERILGSVAVIAENESKQVCPSDITAEKEEPCDEFYNFSELLGESVEEVKDEFRFHEIKRLAEKLGKITVRYELKDSEAAKIVNNCSVLSVGEILASPAYLGAYRKAVNKSGLFEQKICALIDFPFGESTFKSKVADIKTCLKYGVDGFTVVMPSVAVKDSGEFKSQIKKLAKISEKPTGVAFSAQELDAEKIKLIMKTAEKTGILSITFIFGEATEEEIKEKTELIRKNKGKKEVRIMGNVKTGDDFAAIRKLGADKVLTPFADDILKELVKRFNVKRVKLL